MASIKFFRKSIKVISWTLSLLVCKYSISQKQANIWYFGGIGSGNPSASGIDFNTNPPTSISSTVLHTMEACATISDSNGALLFYTDGRSIWNRNHNTMPGGYGLGGDNSTSQTIIVPQPEKNGMYYVFTMDAGSVGFVGDSSLSYAIVDMNLNGGLGDVTQWKTQLMKPATEKITAVKHCNKKDFWIITHQWQTNAFYVYLLTKDGLLGPYISNVGRVHDYIKGPFTGSFPGEMKASHDGSKLAIVCGGAQVAHPQNLPSAELFDFDVTTGVISNPITLGKSGYGVEFSPNNSKLYISTLNNKIRQFDLSLGSDSASIVNSELSITVNGRNVGAMQLAPDGKIYGVKAYATSDPYPLYIAIINSPDLPAFSCAYVDSGFALTAGRPTLGLPNFYRGIYDVAPPLPKLNPNFNYSITCQSDSAYFSDVSAATVDRWMWVFGDTSSIFSDTSYLKNPVHFFSSPGNYTVKLFVGDGCQKDSIIKTINIGPPISALGNDTVICKALMIDAGSNSGASYYWNPSGETTQKISVVEAGTYDVTIVSLNGCRITDTIHITESDKDCKLHIFAPLCFSPNRDGINDIFLPIINPTALLANYSFKIFNRWGELFFETRDVDDGWDGTYSNKEAQEDVYGYEITGITGEGQISYKKHVTLIR